MTSFAELTKQVHLINDLILSDMTCGEFDSSKEALTFSKHLLATKYWYARISYANKKKYLLALIHDVRSAWALSLLLKSMWNCRPKDAVMSVTEHQVYTSYDQAPLDHNRTAMPSFTLAQVMKNDRIWFSSLDPEPQALVLSELTTVAGGPAMWEVLRLAQRLFERNRDLMLKNIQECVVVTDQVVTQKSRTDQSQYAASDVKAASTPPPPSEAQKALDANLTMWNGTIKSMRDNLKLEELEMTFNDGTKRKIWRVNRPKPEITETVDFIQQLPSAVGKRILAYLPHAQLGDYAKVNRYWAYLVDELRTELVARTKINVDCDRLNELLLRHDTSLELFVTQNDRGPPLSSHFSTTVAAYIRRPQPCSLRPSEKSAGLYSHRQFISEKLTKPMIIQKPIRNMMDLSERLERRGAADENIWKWCGFLLAHAKKHNKCRDITKKDGGVGGVLSLGNVHFPCPLMKLSMQIPLDPPMYKDPIMTTSAKPKKPVSVGSSVRFPKDTIKRYNLWTRDLSGLYQVLKIPSYVGLNIPKP